MGQRNKDSAESGGRGHCLNSEPGWAQGQEVGQDWRGGGGQRPRPEQRRRRKARMRGGRITT